ncbi:MAG: ATP-dependent DNA helicase RecG [Lachnospiraceae bacterium]|nr:ATP-dependent DNA helicase RecG [Lachnospiraceae bacterium]
MGKHIQNSSVQELKGIGEKTAKLLEKLHISTVDDLLHLFPRDYDRMEEVTKINQLIAEQRMIIKAQVIKNPIEKKAGRLTITNILVADDTGMLGLTFFNMPYIKNTLKKGSEYYFRGKVLQKGTSLFMEQPMMLVKAEYEKVRGKLLPIYPLTHGLTQNILRKAQKQALSEIEFDEYLPKEIIMECGLLSYQDSMNGIHFPSSEKMLIEARNRLVFDEFLKFLLQVRHLKNTTKSIPNDFPMIEVAQAKRFVEMLPFKLTTDQQNAWHDILEDMTGAYAMNRLIQGDVGSGKTVLAALALITCAGNGYQGALMAPTEVLAVQHYHTFVEYARKYDIRITPVLLTGSMKVKERREAYEKIENGEANVIIGTHALIQEKLCYHNLALVITDEQHRFGVRQRESFASKNDKKPHVMVMSATPIPRTLAMILYGDLHISLIKELPADRLPIKNCVVGKNYRETSYRFLEKEILAGRQAFVICPMIEKSEESDLENVEEYTEKLKSIFPSSIQIASLHGKMKPQEKNRIMDLFTMGEIDILVSTTVIEVGVNVPNATVMMVENAERFGLAGLHQIRGRVGRGKYQSYCIFIDSANTEKSQKRLNILNQSNDGFYIAEQDLKLRGPGDLFGIRQSGEMQFQLADIYQDSELLIKADRICERLLKNETFETDEKYAKMRKNIGISDGNIFDFPSI